MQNNLRNTQANVVPDSERLEIIAEAKSQALAEIVKRAKTIAQLDEVLEYGADDMIEISNQKSIKLSTLVSQFKNEILAAVGSIFTYCGSVDKYSELPADVEIGDVYDVKEAHDGVPAGTNYVWNGTDWDALSGAINLDGYATIEQIANNYVQKVVGKELIATEKIEKIDEIAQELLSCVKFVDLGSGRKCIQLNNNDLIVGASLDGSTYNLIMLSKFDIVDVGTASKKLNFNVPKGERPTVQEAGQSGEEAHKIAYLEDIPEIGEGVQGPQGPVGPQGAVGPQGPQGPQGAAPVLQPLTIKYNGVVAFTYDGTKGEQGNFVVTGETVPYDGTQGAQSLKAKLDALEARIAVLEGA